MKKRAKLFTMSLHIETVGVTLCTRVVLQQ